MSCDNVDVQTLAFTYRDSAGRLLTREPARGGKSLEPVDVAISVIDEAAITEDRAKVDGLRMRAENVRQVVARIPLDGFRGAVLYGSDRLQIRWSAATDCCHH